MKPSLSFFAAALLLALAACTPPSGRPAPVASPAYKSPPIMSDEGQSVSKGIISPQAKSIKVALLIPLSGESVAVGNAMFDAASMALYDSYVATPSDDIRTQIILLPKDTGNTPAGAVRAAKEALEQGTSFIIGPLFSQSVSAVAPLIREANVDMLTFSNNRAVAGNQVYVFGFLPEQQVGRIAEYAYLHKYQRVALLAPNDAYGQKVREALAEAYAQKGGLVSPSELYAPSQANIDAAVSRLATSLSTTPEERRFQAIFIADGGSQLKNIVTALKKTNIDLTKIKLLGTGLWDDPAIANIPEMHGAWFPSSPPDVYQDFETHFIAVYGYKPIRLASLAYDAVSLATMLAMPHVENGINAASLTDPRGYQSPANGLFRLRPDGTSERKLAVMEVTPSRFKVVEPALKQFDIIKSFPK